MRLKNLLSILVCALAFNSLITELFATNLLIKIPTRSRPGRFMRALESFTTKLSGNVNCHFLIACDSDDGTMNNAEMKNKLEPYENLTIRFDDNHSKVEACNRGIEEFVDWFDIVLLASDDMVANVEGYDQRIAEAMKKRFSDFDGVLNCYDGHVGVQLITYPILGKGFYKRFGYVYHPDYKSLFCDNELTLVARKLNREEVLHVPLLLHLHPVWGYPGWDVLYKKNDAMGQADRSTFEERRAHNFYLDAPR